MDEAFDPLDATRYEPAQAPAARPTIPPGIDSGLKALGVIASSEPEDLRRAPNVVRPGEFQPPHQPLKVMAAYPTHRVPEPGDRGMAPDQERPDQEPTEPKDGEVAPTENTHDAA